MALLRLHGPFEELRPHERTLLRKKVDAGTCRCGQCAHRVEHGAAANPWPRRPMWIRQSEESGRGTLPTDPLWLAEKHASAATVTAGAP